MSFLKKVRVCASDEVKIELELVLINPKNSDEEIIVDLDAKGYFTPAEKGSFQDGLQMEPDEPANIEDIEATFQKDFEFMGQKYKKGAEVPIALIPYDDSYGAELAKSGNLDEKWEAHIYDALMMKLEDSDDDDGYDERDEDRHSGTIRPFHKR